MVENKFICLDCDKEVELKKCSNRRCKSSEFILKAETDDHIYYECYNCQKELKKKKTDPRVLKILEEFYNADEHPFGEKAKMIPGRDHKYSKQLLTGCLNGFNGDALEEVRLRKFEYFKNKYYRTTTKYSFVYFCQNFDLFMVVEDTQPKSSNRIRKGYF